MGGGIESPIPSWSIRRNSPFDLLSNGQQIVKQYLFISDLPETTISINLVISDPGN